MLLKTGIKQALLKTHAIYLQLRHPVPPPSSFHCSSSANVFPKTLSIPHRPVCKLSLRVYFIVTRQRARMNTNA